MKDLFGKEPMKALSWKEPYATLMLHGKVETRTWHTSYRGLVLICSSKQPYASKIIQKISGADGLLRILNVMTKYIDSKFYRGNAIAVGRLVDCRPMIKSDEEKTFVQYREPWEEIKIGKNGKKKKVMKRLYCHIYADVKPIKPISWKGVQGWKRVEQNIIDKIEFL